MSFKSLLSPVQPTPACQQALPHIVEFAKQLGADLTGLSARAPIFLADPWIISGDIVQTLVDDDAAMQKEAEDRFRAASASLNGHAHWRTCHDYPNTAMNIEAAGADLIVTCREKGPEASTAGLPSLVLESGLPVLILPDPASAIRTDTIMVAWRNTADARRAVSAALPFLEKAETVTVVQVATPDGADDAWVGLRAVRERLKLHGIEAEIEVVLKGHEADVDALLNAAQERSVDMIVLGGYGHARAREWILGGVTQDLLNATTVPLLMVH